MSRGARHQGASATPLEHRRSSAYRVARLSPSIRAKSSNGFAPHLGHQHQRSDQHIDGGYTYDNIDGQACEFFNGATTSLN